MSSSGHPWGKQLWQSLGMQGTEGTAEVPVPPRDAPRRAPDLLISEVDSVAPGIDLAPGHCNHPDPLEAIPVDPWAERQRPLPTVGSVPSHYWAQLPQNLSQQQRQCQQCPALGHLAVGTVDAVDHSQVSNAPHLSWEHGTGCATASSKPSAKPKRCAGSKAGTTHLVLRAR